jgi:threonine aldolase
MIDLYSDTLTKPSPGMRDAMARADVADEQRREDPTTNSLQDRVAKLLGKEAAVFLPSGAMCNAIAVKTHTQPGDAILCERYSHIYRSEFGGAALLSAVTTEPIDAPATSTGIFTPEQTSQAIDRFGAYGAIPRLLCIEQTHNYGGGAVWPLEQLRAVCDIAHQRGLKTHMDGARLFNASIATGISARDFASECDSVWVDFSKGLGCPVGAVLAGTKEFIDRAWRWKHTFGGAMRQSGILAAAGIYALDHNIDRLADDHANASLLAEGLSKITGVRVDFNPPATNIVFFDTTSAGMPPSDFVPRLLAEGVRMGHIAGRIRAVTHMDVSRDQIHQTVEIARRVLSAINQ